MAYGVHKTLMVPNRGPMPKRWHYNHNDVTTWVYLDCIIMGKDKHLAIKWVDNPRFKYGHLVGKTNGGSRQTNGL